MKYHIGSKFGKTKIICADGIIRTSEIIEILGFYESGKQYWLHSIPQPFSGTHTEYFYTLKEDALEYGIHSGFYIEILK